MGSPLDGSQAGLYADGVSILNTYLMSTGVCILPIAQDPPTSDSELATWSPVVILRLHAPYRIRKTKYSTTKQNQAPIVPAPTDVGKFIFIGGALSFNNNINGSLYLPDWSVDNEYVYVENCVSRNQDGFVLGSPPFSYNVSSDSLLTNTGTVPTVGAISAAGPTAIAGYTQGSSIVSNQSQNPSPGSTTVSGELPAGWVYNNPTFFPGQLLNDTIVGGSV